MTILEYLQDMELEDRVALVGCAATKRQPW